MGSLLPTDDRKIRFVVVLRHLRSESGTLNSLVRGSLPRPEFHVCVSVIILQNIKLGFSEHPIRMKLKGSLWGYVKEIGYVFDANRP